MTNPFFTGLEKWSDKNKWATQDTSGVGGYGAAISSAIPSSQEGRFSIDKNAGFKGSFQGLSQSGAVGAVIGGVTAQLGESGRVKKELDGLQTGVEGVTYDGYGNPVYGGEAVSGAMATVNELDKGYESMKFGKGLDPASTVFNLGNMRRIRRKRAQLQRNLLNAQTSFNKAEASNRALMNNLEGYQERMNPQDRLFNLYRSQANG
jgi:hypothetical protein